ncbi:MAG: hypothetical protein NXI24_21555 [bacterium]|nr:hypothetical protein [bacterium]
MISDRPGRGIIQKRIHGRCAASPALNLFQIALLAVIVMAITFAGPGCTREPDCREAARLPDAEFAYGINYAWRVYGGDFGGILKWKQVGVAASYTRHLKNFQRIKRETGAKHIRWWLWPDLRGDGIRFEKSIAGPGTDSKAPGQTLRPGRTLFDDLDAALRLAHATDTRLILCLFSFEAFAPARRDGGLFVRNLEDVLRDAQTRESLMRNIIRPLSEFIARHPHGDRVFAYDLINEPEWSLRGRSPHGDPGYTPLDSVRPVSHEFMQEFLIEMARELRAGSRATSRRAPLLTIGQASPEWRHAWRDVPIDFDQWHLYRWMESKPYYMRSPVELGFCRRPVVIGEMPLAGLHDERNHTEAVLALRSAGYAGAWTWSFLGRVPTGAKLNVMRPAARALANAAKDRSKN